MAEGRAIAAALAAVLLAAAPVGTGTAWAGQAAASEGNGQAHRDGSDAANGQLEADQEGQEGEVIDVIATLRLPQEAQQNDTASIEVAQDALIADLRERNVEIGAVRRFRLIPVVALRLPIESAGAVLQSPHVSAIEPDRLIPLPDTPDSGSKAD